jgi:hypothetical protein
MADNNSIEVRNATRLKPAGICIYCGRKDRLTEEHVVPFALGGNLILPDASCPECCKMTSAFERKVLRGFMHNARIAGNFPTRHRKNRPTCVPIRVKQKDDFESVELPLDKAIGVIFLPQLEPAGFLADKPSLPGIKICGTQVIGFGKSLDEIAKELGVKTLQFTSGVETFEFVRMIAKIGYSYAVANLGPYPLNEVPVLPFIREESDDGSIWVGSADYELDIEEKKPQHSLALVPLIRTSGAIKEDVLVTRVKLFASSGAKGYEVVVRRNISA